MKKVKVRLRIRMVYCQAMKTNSLDLGCYPKPVGGDNARTVLMAGKGWWQRHMWGLGFQVGLKWAEMMVWIGLGMRNGIKILRQKVSSPMSW